MTKLICKGQHWEIKDGQLRLDTPNGQEALKAAVRAIERQVRQRIYDEIVALNFTESRKQIVKNGIENTALTVQDLIAQLVLGEK